MPGCCAQRGEPPAGGWPAVLALHQHAGQFYLGKAEPAGLSADSMYHYGLDLCRRGYLVLCPDHLCFEDRRPPEYVRVANSALNDRAYERFEFTQRLLKGSCLQTKYLHDMVCALDLLAELPDVDGARLGAIGHSLGGQEALWLAWYDQRVRAAVSSCGFGLIRTIIRDAINHNYALYVPGLLELVRHRRAAGGDRPARLSADRRRSRMRSSRSMACAPWPHRPRPPTPSAASPSASARSSSPPATASPIRSRPRHTPFLIAGWASEWCYNHTRAFRKFQTDFQCAVLHSGTFLLFAVRTCVAQQGGTFVASMFASRFSRSAERKNDDRLKGKYHAAAG